MLEHLETYINAQKAVAHYMIALGVVLLIGALFIHLTVEDPFFQGFKIGQVIFGLFSLIGGFGYSHTEDKLLKVQTSIYQKNTDEFNRVEKDRMQKVVNNHPVIQIILVSFSIVALVVNLCFEKPFVNGILFAMVLLMVGNLIIESVSKKSIIVYFEQLSNLY